MLARLIALLATGEVAAVRRRVRSAAAFYAAIGVTLVLGLFFLVLAGYLAVAIRRGPIEAALWFGIGFLVVGLLLFAVYKAIAGRRKAEADRRAESLLASASALAVVPVLLGKKGRWAAFLMLLAGAGGYAVWRELERKSRKNAEH